MEKRGRLVFLFAVLLFLVFLVMHKSNGFTGLAAQDVLPTYDGTVFTASAGVPLQVSLNEHFYDFEGEQLEYSLEPNDAAVLEGDMLVFNSDLPGEHTVTLLVSDGANNVYKPISFFVEGETGEPDAEPEPDEPDSPALRGTSGMRGVSDREISDTAYLDVIYSKTCPPGYTDVLHLRDWNNSHVELPNESNYNISVCVADTSGRNVILNSSGTVFLKLSSSTNAHVELPNMSNYNFNAYIDASSDTISCSYPNTTDGTCTDPAQTCLVTVSTEFVSNFSNMHVTACNSSPYETSVCCGISFACPLVVNTSFVLDENITCPSTAVNITADNLVFDCNGSIIEFDSAGGGNDAGILASGRDNVTIKNCIIRDVNASGAYGWGIGFVDTNNSLIDNNSVQTNGSSDNYGVYMNGSELNDVVDTFIATIGTSSYGISVLSSQDNSFTDTIFDNTVQWLSSDISSNQNNFSGTAFQNVNGSINSSFFQVNGSQDVTKSKLYISNNTAFLNSSNLSFLNKSAQITLNNIVESNPQPIVDFDDDGVFEVCTSPQCVEVSFVGDVFVFNVSSFTSYSTTQGGVNLTLTKSDSSDPVNLSLSSLLNYTILVNVTGGVAFNATVNESYSDNVSFVSASPAPDVGDNVWNLGNLTAPVVFEINVTVNVSSSLANGTVINNTVNLSYSNSTGADLSVGVVENTTVVKVVGLTCPLIVSSDFTLTENLSCPDTAVNITGDDLVFDCNGFTVDYGTVADFNDMGIYAQDRNNITVRNCDILTSNASSGENRYGIHFDNVNNSRIVDNSVVSNGTIDNDAIYFVDCFDNVVESNNLSANARSDQGGFFTYDVRGVLLQGSESNVFDDNVVSVLGNGASHGFGLALDSDSNNLTNNIITTDGTDNGDNFGVEIIGGIDNRVVNNVISTDGDDNNYGVYLRSGAAGTFIGGNNITTNGSDRFNIGVHISINCGSNTIDGNRIVTDGDDDDNQGIRIRSAGSVISNNFVSTFGGQDNYGLYASEDCTFSNNTVRTSGDDSYGVYASDTDSTYDGTVLNDTVKWIFTSGSGQNDFTNVSFLNSNGTIKLGSFSLIDSNDVDKSILNIFDNRAFLDSVSLSSLNVSGQVSLSNPSLPNPQPIVDFDDDGVFEVCTSPQCVEVSFVGGVFVFNVSSFTSYSTTQGGVNLTLTKSDSPDPVNLSVSSALTYTILINVTDGIAFNTTVNETYPPQVTFVSASPAPDVGNSTWFAGNLSSAYEINITVNVDGSVANGTVINNTVNISYANSTGALFDAGVDENTTIVKEAVVCPLNVNTDTVLSQNLSCPATAVNITGDDLVFDCAGNTVSFDSAGGGSDSGVLANGRDNITIKNCIIRDINASGSDGIGVRLLTSSNSQVLNVSVYTNGTSNNYGVYCIGGSNNNVTEGFVSTSGSGDLNIGIRDSCTSTLIAKNYVRTSGDNNNVGVELDSGSNASSNEISTSGSGAGNYGLFFDGSNAFANDNNISTYGSFSNFGVYIGDSNNSLIDNVVNSSGSGISNYGVYINGGSSANIVRDNKVYTNGTFSNRGIVLISSATNNSISGNRISAGGTDGNDGIYLESVFDNSFAANIIWANTTNSYGINLRDTSNNNSFLDTTFNDTVEWIKSESNCLQNNLTNATFQTTDGSINVIGLFQLNGSQDVTRAKLNISNNSAFLDSNNLTFLNQSARITLNGIAFSNPLPIVDFEDDGSFIACDPPQCNEVSFTGNVFIFDVQSFTTYSTNATIQNVTLVKLDAPDPVTKGQQLNYAITINNTGTATIFNATLNDTLPAGVVFDGSSPLADIGDTFFDLGNITAGQSVSINITVNVSPALSNGTVLNNTANLSFTNSSGGDVSFAVSALTTVLGFPEISTFKSDSPDPVPKGTQLNYSINVTNFGDDTAFNVTVFESYPSGVLFDSSSPAPSLGNDTFSLGNLTPNASVVLNITVNVSDALSNGTVLNNSYNITFANSTGDNATISNSTLTTVLGRPVITVNKSDSPDPVAKGNQLNYSILVNNTGDDTAFNVTLVESYPAGVVFDASQPAPSSGNDTFVLGNLTPNGSLTINITVNVSPAVSNGTVLNNSVNVTFSNSTGDNSTVSDFELTTVLGFPEISTFKTDFPDPVPSGSQLSYQINVTNFGDDTAFDVNITESYPANVTFGSSSPPPSGGDNVFSLGNLLPGRSILVNITVNVSSSAPNGSILNNSYIVDFANSSGQIDSAENSTLTTVTGVPVVVAIKSDSPDPVVRGEQLLYTIFVNNTGSNIARNVTVNESYPAGVTFDSSQPLPSVGNNVFELGNLSPSQGVLINITVNVSAALANGTVLNNTINASFVNVTNSTVVITDSELTTVIGIPNVTINKTADPAANTTENFNYSITIQNTGDYRARNAVLTESYPSGVNFVSSQPSPTGGNNVFNLGSVAAGKTFVVNITVKANTPGLKNNSVSFSFTNSTGAAVVLLDSALTNVTGEPVRPPQFTGGLGGRGGGGGGGLIPRDLWMISDEMITPPVRRRDRVHFNIDDEEHVLEILRMTFDAVTFSVTSTPQVFTLKEDQYISIDVNLDGSPDLRVKVINLRSPIAVLELIKLKEPSVSAEKVEVQEKDVIEIEPEVYEPDNVSEPASEAKTPKAGTAGSFYGRAFSWYTDKWTGITSSLWSALNSYYAKLSLIVIAVLLAVLFIGEAIRGRPALHKRSGFRIEHSKKATQLHKDLNKLEKDIESINKMMKEYDEKWKK